MHHIPVLPPGRRSNWDGGRRHDEPPVIPPGDGRAASAFPACLSQARRMAGGIAVRYILLDTTHVTEIPQMKFGIHNPSWLFGPDPAEIFEATKAKALWAEEHG